MIYNLSKKIAFYFVKKGIVSQEEADVYRFGIETIICSVVDVLIAIIAGIVYRNLLGALWFFLIFAVLRQLIEGYHAKTFVGCKVLMTGMMFLVFALEPFLESGYSFACVGLMVLFMIVLNEIKCNKIIFTFVFVGLEAFLYFYARDMAVLMLMAYFIVMFAALVNYIEEVRE